MEIYLSWFLTDEIFSFVTNLAHSTLDNHINHIDSTHLSPGYFFLNWCRAWLSAAFWRFQNEEISIPRRARHVVAAWIQTKQYFAAMQRCTWFQALAWLVISSPLPYCEIRPLFPPEIVAYITAVIGRFNGIPHHVKLTTMIRRIPIYYFNFAVPMSFSLAFCLFIRPNDYIERRYLSWSQSLHTFCSLPR